MSDWSELLPGADELKRLVCLHPTEYPQSLWEKSLLGPVRGALSGGGKRFRSQILRFAFDVADGGKTPSEQADRLCMRAGGLIEAIHTASMIVDDIEDQSLERRGKPALYREYGLPVALNAGNWLYFRPLEQVRDWGLKPESEVQIYRHCVDTLVRAHYGQALDVGVPIDQVEPTQVWEICMASLELKTGALMALASSLGGALGGADPSTLSLLQRFGISFGVALQMFDDIGNLQSKGEVPNPKRFEDLCLRRPSWIWACASRETDSATYASLQQAVQFLPGDSKPVEQWLEATALAARAKALAIDFLDRAFDPIEEHIGGAECERWVGTLSEKLRGAYV